RHGNGPPRVISVVVTEDAPVLADRPEITAALTPHRKDGPHSLRRLHRGVRSGMAQDHAIVAPNVERVLSVKPQGVGRCCRACGRPIVDDGLPEITIVARVRAFDEQRTTRTRPGNPQAAFAIAGDGDVSVPRIARQARPPLTIEVHDRSVFAGSPDV